MAIENIWNKKLADDCKALWKDAGIQACFNERHQFQLDDSTKYYMDDIDRISEDDYTPTLQDILQSRVRTGGAVSECDYDLGGHTVRMVDVGGQRCERKKWIHCFEGVSAIFFVTSLSEYNQKCYEDDETNRMKESLLVFDEIVNSRWFTTTPIILFLNKEDLFLEKIKTHDLKICFAQYGGGNDPKAAVKYITQRFIEKNKNPDQKKVYVHVISATNTEQLKDVFNMSDIRDCLLRDEKMM
jgi:guanine nucleotide-binding protein G(i) subunit alpha